MPKNKTYEVKDYGSGWTAKEITNDMNDKGRLFCLRNRWLNTVKIVSNETDKL
jgi:hypothetical protein